MKGALGLGQVVLILGILTIGTVFLTSTNFWKTSVPLTAVAQQAVPGAPVAVTLTTAERCTDQATNAPEIRPQFRNSENSTGDEYLTGVERIYKGKFSLENLPTSADFVATLTPTSTTDVIAVGSGTACSCGSEYTAIQVVSDNTSISGILSGVPCRNRGEPDASSVQASAQQAALISRVYDEERRSYVYDTDSNSLNVFSANGRSFYNTTNNGSTGSAATGLILGVDEGFTYTLSFKTNASAADDRVFTDQGLLLAFDVQDSSDWGEPVYIQSSGVTFNKVSCPSQISNDGWDLCYETSVGGQKWVVRDSQVDLKMNFQSKSGVNPSDDIEVGFFNKGLIKSVKSTAIFNGFYSDAASPTYHYTPAQWTFVFQ